MAFVKSWQCEQTVEMKVSATILPRYWLNEIGAAPGRSRENGGALRGGADFAGPAGLAGAV